MPPSSLPPWVSLVTVSFLCPGFCLLLCLSPTAVYIAVLSNCRKKKSYSLLLIDWHVRVNPISWAPCLWKQRRFPFSNLSPYSCFVHWKTKPSLNKLTVIKSGYASGSLGATAFAPLAPGALWGNFQQAASPLRALLPLHPAARPHSNDQPAQERHLVGTLSAASEKDPEIFHRLIISFPISEHREMQPQVRFWIITKWLSVGLLMNNPLVD